MSSEAVSLPPEIAELVEQKRFEELEDRWTARMESDPADLGFFFSIAAAVKKRGGAAEAASWLRFLADYEAEQGSLDARLSVLIELARMFPADPEIRRDLETALLERFPGHPSLRAVLEQSPIAGAADPSAAASRARRWLAFAPGDVYAMPGRGAGRVVEMNPALDVIRLDFSGARVPFSLVSAEKNLTPLPPEHFLRRKLEDLPSIQRLADENPAETVRLQLESFGRPLTTVEVKDNMASVLDEARWTSFWSAARKHPQLLLSGSGKNATVSWTDSAGAAEDAIRAEFADAGPERKLELARKSAKRSKELAAFFAERLAAEASGARTTHPVLAWELSRAAIRLAPGSAEAFPAAELLAIRDVSAVLPRIRDHVAREEALEAIRAGRPDWYEIFAGEFIVEEDSRVLSVIFESLGADSERRAEIVRRALRSPRTAPRAFLWLCERLGPEAAKVAPSLFSALLDALRQDEFSPLRARVKELFSPGGLAVELARAATSEEQAREYVSALDRAGGLEEHRRALVREALLMKFPELRAPAREYLYSTPEAIEDRRRELAHLKTVELPANAEAMRTAKEHGDLTENFEYHAARQRHEYLSARIASLADELSRSRALDPSRIDASEVRVGTRVVLLDLANGGERTATILGPWDSRPEDSIYSYESDFAQSLLGSKPGDRVRVSGGEVEVVSIAPWR